MNEREIVEIRWQIERVVELASRVSSFFPSFLPSFLPSYVPCLLAYSHSCVRLFVRLPSRRIPMFSILFVCIFSFSLLNHIRSYSIYDRRVESRTNDIKSLLHIVRSTLLLFCSFNFQLQQHHHHLLANILFFHSSSSSST